MAHVKRSQLLPQVNVGLPVTETGKEVSQPHHDG